MNEAATRRAGPGPWWALRSRALLVVLLLAWTGLLWALLTKSSISPPGWIPWRRFVGNFSHAPLFGIQAVLLALAFAPGRPARGRVLLVAGLLVTAYGGGLEWIQGRVGRTPSLLDVATDAAGAFGVPWALSGGRIVSPRALIVMALAAIPAGLASVPA